MLILAHRRIPNLPFFYLVYRAWSHWRALSGGKHVQWLIDNKLLQLAPSKELDKLYIKDCIEIPLAHEEPSGEEEMLLTQKQAREVAETLDLPTVEIELERAIWQVEKSLGEDQKSPSTDESKSKDQQETGGEDTSSSPNDKTKKE